MNNKLLGKGFKQLLFLLLMVVISPVSLNIGFKALDKYPDESLWIAYAIIGIAALLILITIILGIKTFKLLTDALFNS